MLPGIDLTLNTYVIKLSLLILLTTNKTMETTIRINTDNLTADIIDGIKKMFPHKTVEIIIQSADDTEYILSDPAYASELAERIELYNTKKETIKVKADELI